jgi:hypothetical protein
MTTSMILRSLLVFGIAGTELLPAVPTQCAPRPAPVRNTVATNDTSAFAAIVRWMAARQEYPFSVDLRPIRSDVRDVTAETRATASTEVLSARREVLRALRIAEGQGDRPENCSSIMNPDPPGSTELHRGCPATPRRVVSIAQPRPLRVTVSAAGGAADTQWTSRVILAAMSPGGVSLEVSDYALHREGTRWVVDKCVLVSVEE